MIKEIAKEFGDKYNKFEDVKCLSPKKDLIILNLWNPWKFYSTREKKRIIWVLFPKNVEFTSSETLADTYLNCLQMESNFATTSTYKEYSHETCTLHNGF